MPPSLILQAPLPGGRRLPELDELKGLAILLIVFYHAGGTLAWQNFLHGDLGVDIFVIVSGIGLSLGTGYAGARDFFRRRFSRILPAYWIVLTAYWALNSHFLQLHYTTAEIVLHYLGIHAFFGDHYAMGINESFWFISLILLLYALYWPLRRWLDNPGRLLLAGGVISTTLAFLYFFSGQSSVFGHLALRVPGFFLGLLVGQLLKTGRVALPLSGRLGLALFIVSYVPYTRGIVFHTCVVGALLMFFYAFALRPGLYPSSQAFLGRILGFLGKYSLEIFLIHQPLIRQYSYYCLGRFFNIPSPGPAHLVPAMLVGFALTLFLSVELHRLLARLPWGKKTPDTA